MAINTANTILKYTTDTTAPYDTPAPSKLCDIFTYPDMGSAPTKLDSTTLTETGGKTSILGLSEAPDLTFEAPYDKTVLTTINGLTGTYTFQLCMGASDGIFTWQGQIKAFANGGGVDEVRKMTIVCSVNGAITLA